jgi:uncharacterized membrane protein
MSKPIIHAAISALLLTASTTYAAEMASPAGTEKCYGIAKAGLNDCAAASHQCAGEAKMNGDKKEWVSVPAGLCQKIVGGQTTPEKA